MTLRSPSAIGSTQSSSEERRVVISATFTADDLVAPLSHMMDAAGLPLTTWVAPYNQVFQELLTPTSSFARNSQGVNVLLLRLVDSTRDLPANANSAKHLEDYANSFLEAFASYRQRIKTSTVVVILRASTEGEGDNSAIIDALNQRLQESLSAMIGLSVLNESDIKSIYQGPAFDATSDSFAHIPYTTEYFSGLAIAVARRVNLFKMAPRKVLVLDCDNTLWGGVVGEDGVEGLRLDEPFLSVQRYAISVQARGILLCLASKNVDDDVWAAFSGRHEMVLQAHHIVAHRINWDEKSANLRALARQLNVGLDSFVFLDDNPVECGRMREALPEVVTLQLPEAERIQDFLENLWVFDRASVTAEDVRRTEMYLENAQREKLEAETQDIGEFIASLEINVEIGAPAVEEWARISQLTHRTNQFNFTTRRRSEAELQLLADQGAFVQAVHVRDRFGDYGLVGVVVACKAGTELEVDSFMLSCRVLGRGVEHRIISYLGELAAERGLLSVRLPYHRTEKNTPARAFANSVALGYRRGDDENCDYLIPATEAAAMRYRPGEDAIEVVEARKNDKKPAATAHAESRRCGNYGLIALELSKAEALLQSLRTVSKVHRGGASLAVAPSSDTERRLLGLWESLLNVTGLGVEDDFFQAGGTSLMAVRLFAEIERQFHVHLQLTAIVAAPTVRLLAGQMEDQGQVKSQGMLVLRNGGSCNLFLVHDGDGETLLYRTLAHLLPPDVSVFGIQPRQRKSIPLIDTSIEQMASSYVKELLAKQPHGPYRLGGLCAGGLIAYEMARQIQVQGGAVDHVLLFDAATPQAAKRKGLVSSERRNRLSSALAEARSGRNILVAAPALIGVLYRKCVGVLRYEIGRRFRTASRYVRFRVLLRVLKKQQSWPAMLPAFSFREIYNVAEENYRPAPAPVSAVLLRARQGNGNDRPYREIFEDPTLGWSDVTNRLTVVDVEGGHSSMLQEPYVSELAQTLAQYVTSSQDAN